jgi:hypothetical protein
MYFKQDHQPITPRIPEVIPDALHGSSENNKNEASKTGGITLPMQNKTTNQVITCVKPTVPSTLAKPRFQPHKSTGSSGKIINIVQIRCRHIKDN